MAVISVLAALSFCRAAATNVEIRTFSVLVDGKPAGTYQMTISRHDDGSTTVSGQADIKVTVALVPVYSYSYRGSETWKDGSLLRLNSATNDNGKRYTVAAVAEADSMRVTTNGQQRLTSREVWTTSYWHAPLARFVNHAVPLLDADTGKDIAGKLEYAGKKTINVRGQMVPCTHYRISDGVQVELWYDTEERLIHQEFFEDGHRTVLELTGARRQ